MNKTFWLLVLIGLMPVVRAGAENCWYSGPEGMADYGDCLESVGKERLKVQQPHLGRLHFNNGLAWIRTEKHGWMSVDKKGFVLVVGVHQIDNGPDEFQEGFVRYKRDGKCGYASRSGEKTISPRFDGCSSFNDGLARVCLGCKSVPDSSGEHHSLEGGEWFCIDKAGRRAPCAP